MALRILQRLLSGHLESSTQVHSQLWASLRDSSTARRGLRSHVELQPHFTKSGGRRHSGSTRVYGNRTGEKREIEILSGRQEGVWPTPGNCLPTQRQDGSPRRLRHILRRCRLSPRQW